VSPNVQLQIFNPATGTFVQCDGGNDSMQALLLQLLLQQIETNTLLRAQVEGRSTADTGTTIRSDALLDTSMFTQG
jgi:hypothetical protein